MACNDENAEHHVMNTVLQQHKLRRGQAKATVTRAMTTISKLVNNTENLLEVKLRMSEFQDVLEEFARCHEDYYVLLTDERLKGEAEKYRKKLVDDVNRFTDGTNSWIASHEVVDDHESVSEAGGHTVLSTLSAIDRARAAAKAEKAALEKEIESLNEQKALEKEQFELRRVKQLKELEIEKERFRSKLELEMLEHQSRMEMDRQELELQQKQRELNLSSKLAKANAVHMAYSDVAESELSTRSARFPSKQSDFHRPTFPLQKTLDVTYTKSTPKSVNSSVKVNYVDATENQTIEIATTMNQMMLDARTHQRSLIEAMQLPKNEIQTFDGDPLKYWSFIRAFDNAVDKKALDDGSKLVSLFQFCSGKAKNLLQCCMIKEPNEGYKLARKLLKERFGDDDIIAQAWIDKVTKRQEVKGSSDLQDYADDLRSCQETLDSMGYISEMENRRSFLLIAEKLPVYLKTRWLKKNQDIKINNKRNPKLNDLIMFIASAAREANDPVFGKLMQKEKPSQIKSAPHRNSFNVRSKPVAVMQKTEGSSFKDPTPINPTQHKPRQSVNCVYCGKNHFVTFCDSFKSLLVKDRLGFVMSKQLCVNCFKPGHFGRDCLSMNTCTVDGCGQKHSKFLHIPRSSPHGGSLLQTSQLPPPFIPSASLKSNFVQDQNHKVALPIVAVRVRGKDYRHFVDTYALVDPGGTSSYCTRDLIDMLDVPKQACVAELTTIEQNRHLINTEVAELNVSNLQDTYHTRMRQVTVRPSLNLDSENLANLKEVQRWPHLTDLQLPVLKHSKVQILIGQDMPDLICPKEIRRGKPGDPFAVCTPLGWAINGPLGNTAEINKRSNYIVSKPNSDFVWPLKDHHEESNEMSINDKQVMELWNRTTNLDSDHHYVMNIPFKVNPPNFPNNQHMAQHRLHLLGKRLKGNPELQLKYTAEIRKLIDVGHAELVPTAELNRNDGAVWYLPHHPVLNPKKPEKCRIVFDCSAKCNGTSLNDKIYQGPDLTNGLVGVLLRFRQEPIAFMTDVEGMYHQVRVPLEDRDTLRFLWWEDDNIDATPLVYRMTVHLFGGVWCSSCANFALHRTVSDNADKFSLMVKQTVKTNFYVDDCLKSVSNVDEAVNLAHELKELLKLGGFSLNKWISNSREVICSLPEQEWSKGLKALDMAKDQLPCERALGMIWNTELDKFEYDTKIEERPKTRRGILSIVSSLYDPLGYAGPFVLRAKMIFQQLCRLKYDWDDIIPSDIERQWGRWLKDLPDIRKFNVPRCFKGATSISNQLHHFADASELGYGAVTYLRSVDADGQIDCNIVMSKSRLAPLKGVTIPRLELAAAVEAVKLDKLLRHELEIPLMESVYWSDSMIVLWYIRNEEHRFQTYVANRVSTIREHSTTSQWKHVNGKHNPADDASRGMTASELVLSHRWLHGPSFLLKHEDTWPKQPNFDCKSLEGSAEIKKTPKVYAVVQNTPNSTDALLQRYSSWYKLKRSVAWILRFKSFMGKRKYSVGELTVSELKEAELAIVGYVQATSLTHIGSADKSLKKLSPIKFDDGLWRVGGRLTNADHLSFQEKHPILLPVNHGVTKLIIRYHHEVNGHAGTERVLAEVRRRFWIVNGRNSVRNLLSTCITCKKLRARPATQLMGNLPESRVKPNDKPFSRVGVDYFGPFLVKRARSKVKRYGCLFTCLATRAIHLEVSHGLDTDSFINALQRFIARRGQPVEIWSDNGTNFVGARGELGKALNEWNQHKISSFLQQREVDWTFNPPLASHMGGVWERQIRTVRSVLSGLLSMQTLDDDGLVTLMCIVENIVNSRPITKLSSDPNDPAPLTPNHLLHMDSGPNLPPGLFVKQDLYKRRWKQVQYMSDVFWKRWLAEYLPALQERQKWLAPKRNMRMGDLVLVRSENTSRSQWPLGLVMKAYTGADGKVRSVQVKTQHGVYDRPIVKLCLLEGCGDV